VTSLRRKVGEDLLLLREASLGVLREEDLAVDDHVELARGADDERGLVAGSLLDGRRETRSAGFVVSDVAVLDLDRVGHDANISQPRRAARAPPVASSAA
jgi:hypothetical protein